MQVIQGMAKVRLTGVKRCGIRHDLGMVFYLKSQAGYQRDEVVAAARRRLEEYDEVELFGDINLVVRRPDVDSDASENNQIG